MEKSFLIDITGLVQGVGFRPFVYRLAKANSLHGWVNNQNDRVQIKISGREKAARKFMRDLYSKKPDVAKIGKLMVKEIPAENFEDFRITTSADVSQEVTQVSPDLAVCRDCLDDMKLQLRRINYPFVNCTYCGPRFSIIESLPYDRQNTTMAEFAMCPACRKEYNDLADRRFHAEPTACTDCGPRYTLSTPKGKTVNIDIILQKAAALIDDGEIVVIKGIGGYFIACDATNAGAVAKLRKRKKRYEKPFAVMFADLEAVKKYAFADAYEISLISGIKRPIVLLQQREPLAKGVHDGLSCIGAMLPYMPFHYLLFENLKTEAIVLTSGNFSEEPIEIEDLPARKNLSVISTFVVSHNRRIHNRVDDSVTILADGKPRMIRRSRGFVPEPIVTGHNCEGIFAAGAELNNCFAIGKGNGAILSQHIGDLKNYETFKFYKESFDRFKHLFRFTPVSAVCDLHPDYLSTRFAKALNLPVLEVQHHHAHIASCLGEHGLDEKVIGVSFDGTGYGTDGKIWGGEFLLADLDNFTRPYHFEYISVSGGDSAAMNPWKSALSFLHHYHLMGEAFPRIKTLQEPGAELLIDGLAHKINCVETSSAGRLFDAVAALTGICKTNYYEAEGPMKLEAVIRKGEKKSYPFETLGKQISFRETFKEIIADKNSSVPVAVISAKFHNTIVDVIVQISLAMRNDYGINTVALSGGTFQNRYLLETAIGRLNNHKFKVISNEKVPANDGGIALGQIAVAARRSTK